jgi:hypothetical protein
VDVFYLGGQISLVGLALSTVMTAFAFLTKQAWRFKVVGYTGFLGVLTTGLFALVPAFTPRTKIQGSQPYQIVFDQYRGRVVVAVADSMTPQALTSTLQQVRNQVGGTGRRTGGGEIEIVARTLINSEPGVSQVLYLGTLVASLTDKNREKITLSAASFSQLEKLRALKKQTKTP